jgi:hypothetical protein
MNDPAGYERVTVSVSPPELAQWARKQAEAERRSLSGYVSRLLEAARERQLRAQQRRKAKKKGNPC